MFHVTDLIAQAAPAAWSPDGPDLVAAILGRARGRTHRVDRPGVAPLRLPRDTAALGVLAAALAELKPSAESADALAQALTSPSRALPGAAEHGGREYHLIAATTTGDRGTLAHVSLSARAGNRKRPPELLAAAAHTIDLGRTAEVREHLAQVFQRTEAPEDFIQMRGRRRAPLAAWVGAPPHGTALPSDWRDVLAALSATYGYRLIVIPQPGVDLGASTRRLNDADPELVLLWQPWIGSASVEAAVRRASARAHVAEVQAITWPGALEEFMIWMELQEVRYRAELPEPVPSSVSHALELAVSDLSEHVVILESAYEAASKSPYRTPALILQGLRLIDEVASEWAAGELAGGFVPAFRRGGLDFAADVSQTAKQQFSDDYRIVWEGEDVLMGPHLRFGVGSPETCARIYWYVDRERRKLVVGHIGRHLRDASSS